LKGGEDGWREEEDSKSERMVGAGDVLITDEEESD
jgi:hypothetical protein